MKSEASRLVESKDPYQANAARLSPGVLTTALTILEEFWGFVALPE